MSVPKQVRITSDGGLFLAPHASVTDVETGEAVPNITGVTIEFVVAEPPVAHIRVLAPEVAVTASVGSLTAVCPHCGHESEPDREVKA